MLTTIEDEFLATLSTSKGVGKNFPKDKAAFVEEYSVKMSSLKGQTVRKHIHKVNVMLASLGVFVHEPECARRDRRQVLLADALQYLVNYNANSLYQSSGKHEFSWENLDSAVSSLHRLLMDDVIIHEEEDTPETYKFRKSVANELIKYQKEEVTSATNGTFFLYTYNILQETVYKHIYDLYCGVENGNLSIKEVATSISELMSRCNGVRINSKSLQSAEKKYAKAIVCGENIFEAREVLDRKIGICFNLTNEISDLLEEAADLLEDDGSDLRGEPVDAVH